MARLRSGVLVGWDITVCFWVIKKKKKCWAICCAREMEYYWEKLLGQF